MKLYLYAAAALAALALIAYEVRVHKKAARVDVAEAALEREQKAHKAAVAKARQDMADSEAARLKLATGLQAIADRFNSIQIPAPKTLVKTVEVPGACSRSGVSDQFVSVWNNASGP